nr:DNA-binding protein [Thiohalobacter thiocyanaticus]
MPRSGIKLDDVKSAVSELERRGEAVTQLAVRQALGDTGSLTTIGAHLRTLREGRAEVQGPPRQIPSELTQAMEQSVTSLWTRAQELARADIEAIRQAAQGRVEAAEKELEALSAAFDKQQDHVDQMQTALDQLSVQLRSAEQVRAALEAENTSLKHINESLFGRLDSHTHAVETLMSKVSREVTSSDLEESS